MELEKLKYPIGKFSFSKNFSESDLEKAIDDIALFPIYMNEAVEELEDAELDTPYRQDGWTVRQVIHHCADSHMNCLIRFKLALTELNPIIKPYEESKWAELQDSNNLEISPSLKMIEGIHQRWTTLLTSMDNNQFLRTFVHPASNATISLKEATAMYAWHGNHHLAHIKSVTSK